MKPKILLIDDEEGIRKLLGISLRDAGYPVSIAIDGERGMELFQEEAPEIILTDIKMPGLDGLEVLRRVKALNPDTEVIVITGHGEMEVAIQSLQLDASDFITKPIHDEALFVALRRAEEKLAWRRALKRYNENLKIQVREATEELKKNFTLQENLLQSSLDAFVGTDRQGKIILFNQSAQTLSGYTIEELQGIPDPLIRLVPEWSAFVSLAIQGQEFGPIKNRCLIKRSLLICKTQENIPVQLSGNLLLENGRIIGGICCLQDLREMDRLQKELLRAERLAATGQTVAGMAHAIKNILGGLKGGRFMVNKGLEIKEMKYLQDGWAMVERNIEKISQLTMDLLSFCKERDPEWEIVQPNDLIREVYELYRDQAAERGVRLKLDLDETMEPLSLDPREIYQVLANLVGNAIDACTLGEGLPSEPETIIRSRSLPEEKILLEVRDNGVGMSAEVRKKLFTIFFSTKGSRGTGLGLLLSHKIVQEHEGEIRVESAPRQGAVFQVILPKRQRNEPKTHAQPAA
jgi:two-component system, NtrC family, sensor kinase